MTNIEDDELEVIAGDGSELDVSPVYDHLNAVKPKAVEDKEEKKEIVIPKTKKEKEEENK